MLSRQERLKIGQNLFEKGVPCREIALEIGYSRRTIEDSASRWGWRRKTLPCRHCGSPVPAKSNRGNPRRCESCRLTYNREKAARRRNERPDILKSERQAYKAKLHATGKRKPQSWHIDEVRKRRQQRRLNPLVQRARYISFGELPITRAGALAILQATLRKLLKTRCETEGISVDTVEYRARYAVDPAFRERERMRTSGKRWGNRAEGRDDGSLTAPVIRTLFAAAKKCPYCWQPMRSRDKTLDHKDPLSRGGWHSAGNVLVCCLRCNSRKHDRPWSEWLQMIPEPCAAALRSVPE